MLKKRKNPNPVKHPNGLGIGQAAPLNGEDEDSQSYKRQRISATPEDSMKP